MVEYLSLVNGLIAVPTETDLRDQANMENPGLNIVSKKSLSVKESDTSLTNPKATTLLKKLTLALFKNKKYYEPKRLPRQHAKKEQKEENVQRGDSKQDPKRKVITTNLNLNVSSATNVFQMSKYSLGTNSEPYRMISKDYQDFDSQDFMMRY